MRATEAPSGSWTTTKKAPWSSSGRKPVGVVRAMPTTPTPNAATSTTESTDEPHELAHHEGIAVAHAVDAAG